MSKNNDSDERLYIKLTLNRLNDIIAQEAAKDK